jgi:hypothetical protein
MTKTGQTAGFEDPRRILRGRSHEDPENLPEKPEGAAGLPAPSDRFAAANYLLTAFICCPQQISE